LSDKINWNKVEKELVELIENNGLDTFTQIDSWNLAREVQYLFRKYSYQQSPKRTYVYGSNRKRNIQTQNLRRIPDNKNPQLEGFQQFLEEKKKLNGGK
jgi:hypothetical protein